MLLLIIPFLSPVFPLSLAQSFKTEVQAQVASNKSETITLVFSRPSIEKVGMYDWMKIDNCSYITDVGKPMLPIRSVTMKLPMGSKLLKITADVKEETLMGTYLVLPGPQPTVNGSQSKDELTEDSTVYSSDSPFPSQYYAYSEHYGLDSETNKRVKYLIINVFPLIYWPAEHKIIHLEKITLNIDYSSSDPLVQRSTGTFSSTTLDNLIITSPLLEAQANQLAARKNDTGIPSRVVTTTWIYSQYVGVDNQEMIRNCIKDFVATYDILYVTIFGDSDQVPVRNVYVPDGVEDYTATDLYYADLQGTWDDNHDGKFGDLTYDYVDGFPDVYIGRLSMSTVEYAGYIIDKIVNYQESFSRDQDWTNRIVLAAGTGDSGGSSNLGSAPTALNEYISNMVSGLEKVKLYESAGNLSTDSMRSEINDGSLFLNFAGHGDPDTGLISVGWLFYWIVRGLWWNGFGISDVRSTTNGANLPVVTTMACSTAKFDDSDCIGEWFIGHPTGGAIAYFGSTRTSWCYTDQWVTTGLMGELDWRIYESYYKGFMKLGQMWSESISAYLAAHSLQTMFTDGYLNEKTVMEFVLLGDPTAGVRGDIHIKADGTVDPSTAPLIVAGDNYTVAGNIEDYSVVVEKDNIILDGAGHILQGVGGSYGIKLSGRSNVEILNMTIKKFNMGIALTDASTNNTIAHNNIQNSNHALEFSYSSNNIVYGNSISGSQIGILMYYYSSNNKITANNVTTNSYYSVFLSDCTNNLFYHNLLQKGAYQVGFSGMTNNVWDAGYPTGGNCWSDYSDIDLFNGPYQNLTGSDGIGDSPYSLNWNNMDNYPIMVPWGIRAGPQLVIVSPQNGTYASNSVSLMLQIDQPFSWVGYSLDGQDYLTVPAQSLSFVYRKTHVVNNASGAGQNYQVRIVVWRIDGTDSGENVYLGTKCRPDFGDIRFSSPSAKLDYWLERYDSLKATFWVEIADDLSDTSQIILIYYGSSQATTTSNGRNTFLQFRDLVPEFYQSMGYSSATYNNAQDPGDYFIGGSSLNSTYISPCIWFRYYGFKKYAVTSNYLYFEGGIQAGNHGNCGMDIRVRDSPAPFGWQSSMIYVPNASVDGRHILATQYSGTGHLEFYSTFWTSDDVPEGNLTASYTFNSSSITTDERIYNGSIAHINTRASSDSKLTIYHEYYALAKNVALEPAQGAWGPEETYSTQMTLNATLSELQDGQHYVTVHANDTTGNVMSSATTYFSVDTAPPTISLLQPMSATYKIPDVPLVFYINEPTSWIGYCLDGGANVTLTSNSTIVGLRDGAHEIILYANDTVGYMGISSLVNFSIDTIPPKIELIHPGNETYYADQISLVFDINETAQWIGYSLDGSANVTIIGNGTISGLSEGQHYIVVYANDKVGNEGSSGVYFAIDTSLHDIAVSYAFPMKTIVGLGYSADMRVGVTNEGDNVETFNVTIYYDETAVSPSVTLTLSIRNSTAVKLTWNTNDTGMRIYANYTLKTVADVVLGEVDVADNNRTLITPIHVGVPGDISGLTPGVYDGTCNMRDVQYLILRFNTNPSSSNWNPNADINNDGTVNMRDIQIAILNFNKHE